MTDEFYYKDLKGLQIEIEGSIQKGLVNEVCNFGSGDLLEVSLDDSKGTIYIPFDKDNVSKIDLAHKTITLTPLKGLLV
jgi:16S rRNA processing protein RimM